MAKKNLLKELASQISDALPTHISTLKKDFEKNCHTILTQTFKKFDLITREEFDIQIRVLLRTRKKLDELEKQVKHLESLLKATKRK